MPDAYVLNQFPDSYGGVISTLVEMLVRAGWRYLGSGNGFLTAPIYSVASGTSTITISISVNAVVTWVNHGMPSNSNAPFVITTTGTLPTGITAGATYYVLPTGWTTNSFRISASPGGIGISTSGGTQSGTHTGTNSAKLFTGTGTGAFGWDNPSAWARLQDPAGVRELVVQHDAVGRVKIKYSRAAKFTGAYGGAVAFDLPPTATDEAYIAGQVGTSSNNDYYSGVASSTPGQWISQGVTKSQVICQGFASGTAPYGFWFAMQEFPRGALRGGIIMDPVRSVPEDPDPFVFHIGGANVFSAVGGYTGTTGLGYIKDATQPLTTWGLAPGIINDGCWAFMDPAATQFLFVQPCFYGIGNTSTTQMLVQAARGLASNPFSGKPEALPIVYMRASPWTFPTSGGTGGIIAVPYSGVKGWSTMVRHTGGPRATFKDTIEGKSFIAVGDFWLPWDGVTTPAG